MQHRVIYSAARSSFAIRSLTLKKARVLSEIYYTKFVIVKICANNLLRQQYAIN